MAGLGFKLRVGRQIFLFGCTTHVKCQLTIEIQELNKMSHEHKMY
jgi:hypothetical protein